MNAAEALTVIFDSEDAGNVDDDELADNVETQSNPDDDEDNIDIDPVNYSVHSNALNDKQNDLILSNLLFPTTET